MHRIEKVLLILWQAQQQSRIWGINFEMSSTLFCLEISRHARVRSIVGYSEEVGQS